MKRIIGIILCIFLLTGCATSKLSNGEESIVTFDEGGISAEDLYKVLKEKYAMQEIDALIDTILLDREYDESSDEKEYIKDVIATLKNQYGDDYESTIKSAYGVKNESEMKDLIRLNYRRLLWEEAYAKGEVTDTEINDYYENVTIGDIEASHILIKVNKEEEDAAALEKAKTIITKLDEGESFADLAKDYSDDTSNASSGGYLGYFNNTSNYDENFLEAAKALSVGSYSKEPVKTKYGYHIIYKTDEKEKPTLEDAKETIISIISKENMNNNSNYMAYSLMALRKKYGIKITDSYIEDAYIAKYGEY